MAYQKRADKKGRRIDSRGNVLNTGEYERPIDGRYYYRYTDNKGKVKFSYAPDLETLRQQEKQIERDLADNINTADAKTSLNSMFHFCMEHRADIRDSTRANYDRMWLANVEQSRIGKMKLCDIRPMHISAFYNDLHKQGLKRNSIKVLHGLISSTLDFATQNDIIRRNVASGALKEIKADAKEKTALIETEFEELIQFCEASTLYDRYVPFLIVAVETCMRIGELAGLTWKDIDFTENTISVNHALVYKNFGDGCRFHIQAPKTEKGIRVLPMTQRTREALRTIQKEQMQYGYCEEVIDGYSGFVFTTNTNKTIAPNGVNFALDHIADAYNRVHIQKLPHLSAHILRHSGCSILANKGVNPKALQYYLGHSSCSVTMDIYNHNNTFGNAKAEIARLETAVNQ